MSATEQTSWKDYALLDFGGGEKLERFGEYTLIRPEIAATAMSNMSKTRWRDMAHARFVPSGTQEGKWEVYKSIPETWQITYPIRDAALVFNLQFTQFKHLGIFPEQAENWDFIYDSVKQIGPGCKVLNLFAYTGGASMAAAAAGAEVNHVESMRKTLTWAKQNAESSNLEGIHWILEDALKFLQREAKRGNRYHGIIMDPPAWGRGPKGERWQLEGHFDELLVSAKKLMHPKYFLVLSTYSALPESVVFGKTRAAGFQQILGCQPSLIKNQKGAGLSLGNTLKAANF